MVYANTYIVPNFWCSFELIVQYCSLVLCFQNEVQDSIKCSFDKHETVTIYSIQFSIPADTLLIL